MVCSGRRRSPAPHGRRPGPGPGPGRQALGSSSSASICQHMPTASPPKADISQSPNSRIAARRVARVSAPAIYAEFQRRRIACASCRDHRIINPLTSEMPSFLNALQRMSRRRISQQGVGRDQPNCIASQKPLHILPDAFAAASLPPSFSSPLGQQALDTLLQSLNRSPPSFV